MDPNASGDGTAVHAVAEALLRAVNRADVDGIVACWAPDGVLLPPLHPAVRGHTAIAEFFARVFATRRLTFTFTESTIILAGQVAIERVSYRAVATVVADGATTEDVGKGIHICTRRSDGRWQLAQDIWNSDQPPVSTPQ